MPPVQIRPFDPQTAGPEDWAAYHRFRRIISAELWPDDPLLSDEEKQTDMRETWPLWEERRWVALSGAEMVGTVSAGFRRPGTPNAEEHAPYLGCGGSVLADWRRQGIGTRLLREIHDLMRALGKTVLSMSADTEAGQAFLSHIGAIAKHTAIENRADLSQLDWPRLREWEETPTALGLRWECYEKRVPREVLLGLLPTFTALLGDMPLGALEIAPIRAEIDNYDRWYETMDRVGGAHHVVILRTPEGDVAGLTDAGWDSRTPTIIHQYLTGVARPWRGRGLARALKARMLRLIRDCQPEAATMITHNAEKNAPMLAINARVGFKIYRRFVDYQISREALDDWRSRQAA
jgi:GNAT superfamily N-acetyltransferase